MTVVGQVPMPSYLVALAVGELESRRVGPRTRVWSEPSTVDAGADEARIFFFIHFIQFLHVV